MKIPNSGLGMFPAKLNLAIPPDKPLKIFQADIFGVLPDFLFAFIRLSHGHMLPYMVALFNNVKPKRAFRIRPGWMYD